MFKIAICDDIYDEVLKAEDALACYAEKNGLAYTLYKFSNPMEFINSLSENYYNVALLDICMPGLSGIDLAKEMILLNANCNVIFLTTSLEYAVEAFKVNAVQYVVKPYTQEQFDSALAKALKIDEEQSFIIKKSQGIINKIIVDNIVYVQSDKHYVEFVMNDDTVIRIRSTIDEVMEDLKDFPNFISPHKSYVINMNFVKNVLQKEVVVKDLYIPLSKSRIAEFKDTYMKFIFG